MELGVLKLNSQGNREIATGDQWVPHRLTADRQGHFRRGHFRQGNIRRKNSEGVTSDAIESEMRLSVGFSHWNASVEDTLSALPTTAEARSTQIGRFYLRHKLTPAPTPTSNTMTARIIAHGSFDSRLLPLVSRLPNLCTRIPTTASEVAIPQANSPIDTYASTGEP